MVNEPTIHFLSGALGGTAGAAITCPLEVVKTRLQSSSGLLLGDVKLGTRKFLVNMFKTEGVRSFYKGLVPNLVGIMPTKAIYFSTYSSCKRFLNNSDVFAPNSAGVHLCSAAAGGLVTASLTNPVWFLKTRLQLHQGSLGLWPCVKKIYKTEGSRAFFKGMTASYLGVSETIIQFVVYEYLRKQLSENNLEVSEDIKFWDFMVIGGISKFCACSLTYPHEVVRTRMREEGAKGKGLMRTFGQIWQEGALRSCYRGLSVQLLRCVPNTAITMATYEMAVWCFTSLSQLSE